MGALYARDIQAQGGGGVNLQLGDLVLAAGNFKLATECLTRAKDHSALLLLYSCQVRTCLLRRCVIMYYQQAISSSSVDASS